MNYPISRIFQAYKNCETCDGTGKVNMDQVIGRFNVVTMEFDYVTDERCPECVERSIGTYEAYLENK
jgi:RecJ-like exonuclease